MTLMITLRLSNQSMLCSTETRGEAGAGPGGPKLPLNFLLNFFIYNWEKGVMEAD